MFQLCFVFIETQNKQVLMTEYGKYQELKDKDTRMNKEYHRKLEELDRKIDLATSKLLQAIELKNLKVSLCHFLQFNDNFQKP